MIKLTTEPMRISARDIDVDDWVEILGTFYRVWGTKFEIADEADRRAQMKVALLKIDMQTGKVDPMASQLMVVVPEHVWVEVYNQRS